MKHARKFLAFLLAAALLLTLLPQGLLRANADTPVPEDGVLTARGTRGDFFYLLWWMAGSPEPTSTANPFTDISEEDYYFKAVLWVVEKGITKGTSDTSFSPDQTCTRGQVVTFLFRASGGE